MTFKMCDKNRIKLLRNILTVLMAAMMLISLAGCSEIKITKPLEQEELLEINGVVCTMSVAKLRLLEAKDEYETMEDPILWLRQIGDVTMTEYVKNSVKEDLIRYTASQVMANDLTVYLDDNDMAEVKESAQTLINRLSARYNLSAYGISFNDAVELFRKRLYYNKVYEKISENIGMEISEADTKVIEVKYVFIPISDGIGVAEEIRADLKAGYDFRSVCESYGYDCFVNQTLKKGDMPEQFERYAYALRDNEISEIIETKDGYYLIDCMEDYMVAESVAHSNEIISNAKRENFQNAYEQFASRAKMRFNDDEWDRIDISAMN